MLRQTHTFAMLDLSPAAFREIQEKLKAAGYEDQFHEVDGKIAIDMHGIAVIEGKTQ